MIVYRTVDQHGRCEHFSAPRCGAYGDGLVGKPAYLHEAEPGESFTAPARGRVVEVLGHIHTRPAGGASYVYVGIELEG